MLVAGLLKERPEGSAERAVVLLNGLGTIKYEELFLLFGKVAARLAAAGVEVADVECGELVTSLDMSGLSLTLFWTDEELGALWSAPADTPAFRKSHRPAFARRQVTGADAAAIAHEPASPASQQLARLAALALGTAAEAVHEHERELGDLDAVAGDGDHGAGMRRGVDGAAEAASAAVGRGAGVREVLMVAGNEWSERAGGTSGALWSAALMAMASSLGGRGSYDAADLVDAVRSARDAMVALGQAEPGDKTVIDALSPFVEALSREVAHGREVEGALRTSAETAASAAAATAGLRPRKGRARPLADRSVGSPDPGAVSFALIVTALAAWADDYNRSQAE
jgi:dihydroxyacetone kinase